MIKSFFIDMLETALNHYLSLDTRTPERLTQLTGKLIAVSLTDLDWQLFIKPTAKKLHLVAQSQSTPDTEIKASAMTLLRFGLLPPDGGIPVAGDIKITGDVETGMIVQELFLQCDIDWEEQLSYWVGDSIAHAMGHTARQFLDWSKNTANIFQQNIDEYLHEELQYLPVKAELDHFFNNVDHARMDCDRLTARIERLENISL